MRFISLNWSYNKGEGSVSYSKIFNDAPICVQLDMLQDCIADLTDKYAALLTPPPPEQKNMKEEHMTTADDIQHGGTHYKDMAIQPWAVMESVLTPQEFIGYLKGNIIKYSLRQGKKDSPDADKALHYMQKLKELSDSGW